MSSKPRFSLKDSQVVRSYYRIHKRVSDYFSDSYKAHEWMMTSSVWFGGKSPIDMIEAGRSKKLEDWIVSQLDENEEPVNIKGFEGK